MSSDPTPPTNGAAELREAIMRELELLRNHHYYSKAKENLPEDVREFVDNTAWAGDLHEKEQDRLVSDAIFQAVATYLRTIESKLPEYEDAEGFTVNDMRALLTAEIEGLQRK